MSLASCSRVRDPGRRDRPAGQRRRARRCRGRPRRPRCSRRTSESSPMPMSTKSMTWPKTEAVDEVADGAAQEQAEPDRHQRAQARAMAPLVPGDARDDAATDEGRHQQGRGIEEAEDGPIVIGLGDADELADELGRTAGVAGGDATRGQLEGAVDPGLGELVEQHHAAGQAARKSAQRRRRCDGVSAGPSAFDRGWRLSHRRLPVPPSRHLGRELRPRPLVAARARRHGRSRRPAYRRRWRRGTAPGGPASRRDHRARA